MCVPCCMIFFQGPSMKLPLVVLRPQHIGSSAEQKYIDQVVSSLPLPPTFKWIIWWSASQGHGPRTERAMSGERWRVRLSIQKKKSYSGMFDWYSSRVGIEILWAGIIPSSHVVLMLQLFVGSISILMVCAKHRWAMVVSLDLLIWRLKSMGAPKARLNVCTKHCWWYE